MVGHACPRNDRISHGEALIHSRRGAGLQPGTSPQLFSFVLFCFLTAAHSLDGGKKRKKKKAVEVWAQLKHLKVKSGKCLGAGKAAFKEGKARNQET